MTIEPLNDEHLDEIERMAEAATPGPWGLEADGNMNPSMSWRITRPRTSTPESTARTPYHTLTYRVEDARFLVHLRTWAVPLVKAVREARAVSKGRREEAFDWISAYFEAKRERDEAREQKLAAEQRFDTMEAEYLKAWRESMEAQDSLRLMRAAATNFEKALTAEVAAHAETRAEIDELAIAVGYGERPEGQSGVHRLSGEQLADRWKQLNRELDEAQAEVKRLHEAAWKILSLAGAVCRWPDVADAVAVAQKIHKITEGMVE